MRYPNIDPVLIHIGPFQLRWYGLMYILGFIFSYGIMIHVSRLKRYNMYKTDIEDLLAGCIMGLIAGARIGYCLFYNFWYYIYNPLKIFAVWEGGMSFHGGLIGVILAGWIYSRKRDKPFWMIADLGAISAPPGLFFGRIGNFINAELYGRATDMPWGIIFPGGGDFPRHPSQIYEALLEGVVLFIILYLVNKKNHVHGLIVATFLIIYGIMRFFIEFFREPDAQLGFIIGPFTMGQVLCFAMIMLGGFLLRYRLK